MSKNKKQVYRVILKLLSFLGLSFLGYFIIRTAIIPSIPQSMQQPSPVTVTLNHIPQGKIQLVQWNHQSIAILHRPKSMQFEPNGQPNYLIFVNKGGDLNCPLQLEPSKQRYLQDSCSHYLYDGNGIRMKKQANISDLSIPPYRFIDQNHLLIGEN